MALKLKFCFSIFFLCILALFIPLNLSSKWKSMESRFGINSLLRAMLDCFCYGSFVFIFFYLSHHSHNIVGLTYELVFIFYFWLQCQVSHLHQIVDILLGGLDCILFQAINFFHIFYCWSHLSLLGHGFQGDWTR